jgi:hypothetical protein
VNSQFWSFDNLRAYNESPLHPAKIGVCMWCVVSQCRVIGPIFFEETVNAEHYQTSFVGG